MRPLFSRLLASVLALCFGTTLSPEVRAQAVPEYRVKAAFMLNFGRFVEWPPDTFRKSDDPVSICIAGTDPFEAALDEIVRGQRVHGREVRVRRLPKETPPAGCQIVYCGGSEAESRILPQVQARPVLTVGETREFLESGGIMQFETKENRVRFRVNLTAANRSGLKLSSKLLSVAWEVR